MQQEIAHKMIIELRLRKNNLKEHISNLNDEITGIDIQIRQIRPFDVEPKPIKTTRKTQEQKLEDKLARLEQEASRLREQLRQRGFNND